MLCFFANDGVATVPGGNTGRKVLELRSGQVRSQTDFGGVVIVRVDVTRKTKEERKEKTEKTPVATYSVWRVAARVPCPCRCPCPYAGRSSPAAAGRNHNTFSSTGRRMSDSFRSAQMRSNEIILAQISSDQLSSMITKGEEGGGRGTISFRSVRRNWFACTGHMKTRRRDEKSREDRTRRSVDSSTQIGMRSCSGQRGVSVRA